MHCNNHVSRLSTRGHVVALICTLLAGCGGEQTQPPDRDSDGISDTLDMCPDEPELLNGYDDLDGCPEAPSSDSDGDRIPDASDACPSQPETVNGYQDGDGCPDTVPVTDPDGDGIVGSADACPSQPETVNGHQDTDGCPDTVPPPTDTDGDGIPDSADACPNADEVVNGHQDTDGCPDVSPRFTGRWSGPVTIQLQNEAPFQYAGTVNGTANGFQVVFSPVCPGGDGTMATNTYTDQHSVSWAGTLPCAPVALSGCSSVTFTFTGSAFSLNASNGNLGAAGGGTASGCSISKPFTMLFSGTRQ